jgi:hypothetical protein
MSDLSPLSGAERKLDLRDDAWSVAEVPDIPLEAGSAVVIVVAWRDYPPADQPYRPRSLAK